MPRSADNTDLTPPPRHFGAAVAVVLATVATVAAPAASVTYVLPTDEWMVDRASTIVFGRVLSAAAAVDDPSLPATDFTVDVEEVLKGAITGATVVVRQPGGAGPDGLAMRVGGLRMLREGERVLLFLSERREVLRTVEFALGIFFEAPVRGGGALLEREPSLREDLLDSGRHGPADREALLGPRDGDRFRRWIRDRADGAERPADYFVPKSEIVRGPVAVREPYRFNRTHADCAYADWSMRWTEFERGQTVSFRIQDVGGNPVVGNTWGDVRQAVHNAVRAWNGDGQSRVELRYYTRSFQVPPEGFAYRGRNYILWDDPFDRYPGEVGPDGGVVAWMNVWYWCDRAPVRRPAPQQQYGDVRIAQADITTRKGLRRNLWLWDPSDWAMRRNFEEIVTHELGHALGFDHPCGDEASGACRSQAEREAIMYARVHNDARGARLSSDDRAILRRLYPAAAPDRPPAAPTDVSAAPTNNTTVRVSWRDRSHDEEGFQVWKHHAATGWKIALTTRANLEQAHVHGLRPGERYGFLVRAWRGGLHADSQRVFVTMPRAREPGALQGSQFGVHFSARASGSTTNGRSAGWSSEKGVLYSLFDADNPEALVKVLDGRTTNGHWWLDLAVTSDLHSRTRVTHRATGDEWHVFTGLGRDVFNNANENNANRLVHCVIPASRSDNVCAISGFGTTVSLRDAWDSSGRIPSRYFLPGSAASAIIARAHGPRLERETADSDSPSSTDVRLVQESGVTRPTAAPVSEVAVFNVPRMSADLADRSILSSAAASAVAGTRHAARLDRAVGAVNAAAISTLHGARFDVNFSARANGSTLIGKSADWSSQQGVLYSLFEADNPEALVKVLDGRTTNGHWWLDLAVTSDLRAVARARHRVTGNEWVAITGLGRDVFTDPGGAANRLVHCAFPANRADGRCAVSGYGTTVSLRDAWDAAGRIPSIHYD